MVAVVSPKKEAQVLGCVYVRRGRDHDGRRGLKRGEEHREKGQEKRELAGGGDLRR
jgi:hypothetical protein